MISSTTRSEPFLFLYCKYEHSDLDIIDLGAGGCGTHIPGIRIQNWSFRQTSSGNVPDQPGPRYHQILCCSLY